MTPPSLRLLYVSGVDPGAFSPDSNARQQPLQLSRRHEVHYLGPVGAGLPPELAPRVRVLAPAASALLRAARRALRSTTRWDLVVGDGSSRAVLAGALAARLLRAPHVVLCWDHPFGRALASGSRARRTGAQLRARGVRLAYEGAAAVAAFVHPGVLAPLGIRPRRLLRFRNGVDFARVRGRAPRERSPWRIACLGVASEEKGALHALEALSHLRRRCPRASLRFVGPAADPSALRERARALGVAEAVECTGPLSFDDALRAAGGCAVGLHAYRPRPWLYWNQVLKVGEYQALGMATVAMDAPGTRDLIEPDRTGVLVPHDDPLALAEALAGLLEDPERRRAIEDAARASAAQRSWERVGALLSSRLVALVRGARDAA